MQQKVLKILEFDKVKEQLLEHASSSLGRKKQKDLMPSTDFDEVVRLKKKQTKQRKFCD